MNTAALADRATWLDPDDAADMSKDIVVALGGNPEAGQ